VWWKPVAIMLMLPAFLLAVTGLTTSNPTIVGEEGRVARPPEGVVRVTRHPFLIGVGLWAVVHLIANGDLASFIFFGSLAVTALAGTVSIDSKRRRALGPAWLSFAAQTSISKYAERLRDGFGFCGVAGHPNNPRIEIFEIGFQDLWCVARGIDSYE
jgi:uncharacterized membrane protein